MLRNARLFNNRAYSLVTWVTVFAVTVATFLFIRVSFKRALQQKVENTADYLLWTKWGNDPQQYKGEDNSFSKAIAEQSQNTNLKERKGYITNKSKTQVKENSVSSGVEDGSQSVLKTFDLNTILH